MTSGQDLIEEKTLKTREWEEEEVVSTLAEEDNSILSISKVVFLEAALMVVFLVVVLAFISDQNHPCLSILHKVTTYKSSCLALSSLYQIILLMMLTNAGVYFRPSEEIPQIDDETESVSLDKILFVKYSILNCKQNRREKSLYSGKLYY